MRKTARPTPKTETTAYDIVVGCFQLNLLLQNGYPGYE